MPEQANAITVECLPASYGDCILVACNPEKPSDAPSLAPWRLLIDTGPDECWPVLEKRLSAIEANADGKRRIDLAIISHIDHDHIGGARLLFADSSLGLEFGDVWFNARHHLGGPPTRGVAEGQTLAEILGSGHDVPWNRAFGGGAVATPGDGRYLELPPAPHQPRISVLSPTPKRLLALAGVWDRELARLKEKQSNTTVERSRGSDFPDLKALAAHKTRGDRSMANGSSIAVLLEHRGASVVLAADAFSTVLGSALVSLIRDRAVAHPIEFDAFKLSHHGSRANMLPALLNVIRANHYLISTDNSRFGHPNDETLARVVLYGGKRPTLWFNHETPHNARWSERGFRMKHAFTTRFPKDDTSGIKLELPAKK